MANNSVALKQSSSLRQTLFLIVFAGAFLGAYYPVLSSLVRAWAASDDYSHGFAIIPLALYFVWQKRPALLEQEFRGAWPGLLLAVLSLLCYVVAKKGEMQTAASVSMIFFIWGSVIYLLGYRVFRICLFPLLILFFMVPVPAQIIAALTIPLQVIVTKASVALASVIGIPIYREGNVINLPGGVFEVVQACSGLRSIMALLTLGAAVSYFTLRSNLLRLVLFFLAIPIALAVNIMRVFVLVSVFHFNKIDLSHGTPHTMLGLGVFVAALGLFVLSGKGLSLCER
ncbi:MAG: exosortase A [Geobacteraceae bacterium GWC2_58_44]|nr:MAG: exosortase A [Geobacteraceae bacterium GWC2_58_44]HBG07896.1 exosortase A [Geobacter sp.]